MSTHNIGFMKNRLGEAILMSTHNIGFYKNMQNYHLIIIKYHQIHTLFLLLRVSTVRRPFRLHLLKAFEPCRAKTGF